MKGAIVGNGFIAGKGHLPSYLTMDDVEIVALADITEERLVVARQMAPGIRTYPDYESLLEKERDLDFLDIATPPADHTRIALRALGQGVNVLCEKPLACSSADVLEMVRAAKRNKVVVFPAHNYKHAPIVKRLREIAESGEIGAPRSCTLGTFRTTHAIGTPEWKPDWRRYKDLAGGGIAMDHGSHSFYLTFMFMGCYPDSVSATTFQHLKQFDTEDSVTCMLRFPNGFAHVYLSWTAGIRKVIYSIQGDKGAVFVDEDQLQIGAIQKVRREQIASEFGDASHVSWFVSLFGQFREAIHNDDYAGNEMKDAYYCVRLIEKIYESANNSSREIPIAPELTDFQTQRK
ncbi:MAG: Gfo/Idh/MocA family oxidoreductase [Pseudomonadota bacterium]